MGALLNLAAGVYQQNHQKPPEPPSAGFTGASAPNFETVQTSGDWLIIEAPAKTEYWFSPPATRSELESRYPGAVLVPLPATPADPEQRKLAPAELDELARLIPRVAEHYGCPPEDLAEMRTTAARDPCGALASFTAMARELGLDCAEREPERFLDGGPMAEPRAEERADMSCESRYLT